MFKKLECVCIYTKEIEKSLEFYTSLGLLEAWKIDRILENNVEWKLIGLKFPQSDSSELVLSNNPEIRFSEVEILVDDVRDFYNIFSKNDEIMWLKTPFKTESGHVAVMEAPDGNVFVLVGS